MTGRAFDELPFDNAGAGYHLSGNPGAQPRPSSRAALVLSTVGCKWQEGST